jgi:hypothetical protein
MRPVHHLDDWTRRDRLRHSQRVQNSRFEPHSGPMRVPRSVPANAGCLARELDNTADLANNLIVNTYF